MSTDPAFSRLRYGINLEQFDEIGLMTEIILAQVDVLENSRPSRLQAHSLSVICSSISHEVHNIREVIDQVNDQKLDEATLAASGGEAQASRPEFDTDMYDALMHVLSLVQMIHTSAKGTDIGKDIGGSCAIASDRLGRVVAYIKTNFDVLP
jgi:hypothetical protein